jgi:hypothetical protein
MPLTVPDTVLVAMLANWAKLGRRTVEAPQIAGRQNRRDARHRWP